MVRNEVRVSSRRTLILLVAVGLGLLAAFFLFTYVNGIEDDVRSDIQAVRVLKAVEPIPQGTLGDEAVEQSLVATGEIAREFQPDGAITSADAIAGRVAVFDIPQNLPITQDMFVSESETTVSFRRRLENENWVTATISVDQVGGVAGLVQPGDEVNLMVAVEVENVEEALETVAPTDPEAVYWVADKRYEMLFHSVPVLAVGQTAALLPGEQQAATAEGEEQSVDAGLITFAVPPDAARLIATAQADASLYLSLTPLEYEPAALEQLPLLIETLPGQDPDLLTPCGPDGCGAEE